MGSEDVLARAEHRFGVRFPQDYRDFLAMDGSASGFVPPADDFLVINAVEDLVPVNEAGEIQDRFPGAVVIGGDGSREMLAYDFRRQPPALVLLDVSAPDWSSAIRQASSLTDLLARFPGSGWTWDD